MAVWCTNTSSLVSFLVFATIFVSYKKPFDCSPSLRCIDLDPAGRCLGQVSPQLLLPGTLHCLVEGGQAAAGSGPVARPRRDGDRSGRPQLQPLLGVMVMRLVAVAVGRRGAL